MLMFIKKNLDTYKLILEKNLLMLLLKIFTKKKKIIISYAALYI